MNVYSLFVKIVLTVSQKVIYLKQNILFIDEETLLVEMPPVEKQMF